MKDKRAPLMALALAGIAAPAASASTITETTDWSSLQGSPTPLGAFNPGTDLIKGTLSTASPGDFTDAILLNGTPGTPISIPFSILGSPNPNVFVTIYDNPPANGPLGNAFLSPLSGAGSTSMNFIVPADGNYMLVLGIEGSGVTTSYTLGAAVPEPATLALLATGLAVGAIARRRKKPTKKS
jgi:hypothetical protein